MYFSASWLCGSLKIAVNNTVPNHYRCCMPSSTQARTTYTRRTLCHSLAKISSVSRRTIRKTRHSIYVGAKRSESLARKATKCRSKSLNEMSSQFKGTVRGRLPTQQVRPLHFMMVDVQQRDGMVMVTPAGKKLFIDGGDNTLFARFVANRFPGTTKSAPHS